MQVFCIVFLLANLATSSIRVKFSHVSSDDEGEESALQIPNRSDAKKMKTFSEVFFNKLQEMRNGKEDNLFY